jgi:hypothetical protein
MMGKISVCSTHEEERNASTILLEILKESDLSEDLGVDRNLILTYALRKSDGRVRIGFM